MDQSSSRDALYGSFGPNAVGCECEVARAAAEPRGGSDGGADPTPRRKLSADKHGRGRREYVPTPPAAPPLFVFSDARNSASTSHNPSNRVPV